MDIENINSKANAGITLGTIGTALSGLQWLGGNGLFGREGSGFANAAATVMCGDSAPVSRYEMNMAMKLAAKDSEIALLKSEQNTEVKMADVYERLNKRLLEDKRVQSGWNAQQGITNAHIQDSLAGLNGMCHQITKTIVPITAVCPEPMKAYNSWTAPTTGETVTP